MQINVWLGTGCIICAVLGAPRPAAATNLLADPSFENGINPLPPLSSVVGPPFVAGFWGAERGGEVTAENGVVPFHLHRMLYMENEGLTVTQTFQAVDVSTFATWIDSGIAVANLSAFYNTYFPGLTASSGLMFFAHANSWNTSIGNYFTSNTLDSDPNTWEVFTQSAPIPPLTRWIVVQLGFVDATLPVGDRGYVDAASFEVKVIPGPGTLALLGAGLMLSLRRRRVRTSGGETSCL